MKYHSKKILLLTHTQYRDDKQIHGPVDSLLDFFVKTKTKDIIYIQHSIFQGNGSLISFYDSITNPKVISINFHKNFPNPFRYLIDLGITMASLFKSPKFSIAIAADPLNFFYAYIFKKLNKINTIYFYTLDYSFKRFPNPILNKIYNYLDHFAINHCDFSISACQKICDVRTEQGLTNSKNLYLPNSPILEGVRIKKLSEIKREELVMVFSDPTQVDFQIVFEAVKKLSKIHKGISLKLIGRGNFKTKLIKSAKKYHILNRIKFLDTPTHKDTLEEISTSAIGLECNNQTVSWNEFREPLKIREYFALGLPVISKKGHALIDEITNEKIGFIIENSSDLAKYAKYLFNNPKKRLIYRNRVLKHSRKFDKEKNIRKIFGW